MTSLHQPPPTHEEPLGNGNGHTSKDAAQNSHQNGHVAAVPSPTLSPPLYTKLYSIAPAHAQLVNAVKISANGNLLAACTSTGEIRVYSVALGLLVATLRGHTKGISTIAFSPSDNDILASGLDDMTIRLWSVARRKCLRVLKKHTYHITTVLFNSKGSLLISGAADETIVVWDLTTGRSLKTLAAHSDPVSSVCLTPDDTIIVSASYDGLMRLFDTETGQCLKTLVYNSTSHGTATASTNDVVNFPISHVAISPNGKYILLSSLDGKVRLWDYMSNKVLKTYLGVNGDVVNQTYNSDGSFLPCVEPPLVALGSDSNGVLFWDLQTKQIVFQVDQGETILGLTVAPDGTLVTSTRNGLVSVYSLNPKYASKSHQAHSPLPQTDSPATDTPMLSPTLTPRDT